jgi:hypothetical protein
LTQPLADWFQSEWLPNGPTVCILEGFSGVGKSRLAGELIQASPVPTVDVTAATEGFGADDVLIEIALKLEASGDATMSNHPDGDLGAGLLDLMRRDILIVVDDFEALLDPASSMPDRAFWNLILRLGVQRVGGGRLLLVTSQSLPEGPWQERVVVKTLEAPDESQATHLLGVLLADRARGAEVPLARRADVVKWLGYNPRAFQAMVACLAEDSLDELIELEQDSWTAKEQVVSPELVRQLELRFLHRVLNRLEPSSLMLLELLSVYRKPFTKDAIERLGLDPNVRTDLFRRFLLRHQRGWYSLNRIGCELARKRIAENPRRLKVAHDAAADHFARHFRAKRYAETVGHGSHLVEARYHLVQADRAEEFYDIARLFRRQLLSSFESVNLLPDDQHPLQQLIATLAAVLDDEDTGHSRLRYLLARALLRRGGQDDDIRAYRQLKLASRESLNQGLWLLYLRLGASIDGLLGVRAIADQAFAKLPDAALPPIYTFVAREYVTARRPDEALRILDEGIQRCRDVPDVQYLHSTASKILNMVGRYGDAVEQLMAFLRSVGQVTPATKRTAEQVMFMALLKRDVETLSSVRNLCATWVGSEPFLALCDVLLLQCTDRFDRVAEVEPQGTGYIALTMQVAFSLLCSHRLTEALHLLASSGTQPAHVADAWGAALVYYCNGQDEVAAAALERIMKRPVMASEVDTVLLLRIWDDADSFGVIPAFYFPRLPQALTGLEYDLVRLPGGNPAIDDDIASRVVLPRTFGVHGVLERGSENEHPQDGVHAGVSVSVSPHIELVGVQTTEARMGDTYQVGQAGAVGAGATASGNTFNQILQQGGRGDELADELRLLREAMRGQATEAEHDIAVAELAQAETAVRGNDSDAARSHLARAGEWALARANEIGTAVAAAAIKAALGL